LQRLQKPDQQVYWADPDKIDCSISAPLNADSRLTMAIQPVVEPVDHAKITPCTGPVLDHE
jgi:hypothetical protein